jgi:Asp/Glu/hydantoin racemase
MLPVLLVNPNTSPRITEILATRARAVAGPQVEIRAVTARFGASAIETPADLVTAEQAVLETIAANADCSSVIVGGFTDPGLQAAQKTAAMPVFGLAQSGMLAAAKGGRPFAIVTVGDGLRPEIEQLAARYGVADQLVALRFLPQGVLDLVHNPKAVTGALIETALACVREEGAKAILFGGAPFSGIAAPLAPMIPVPILDGMESAVAAALTSARS